MVFFMAWVVSSSAVGISSCEIPQLPLHSAPLEVMFFHIKKGECRVQ